MFNFYAVTQRGTNRTFNEDDVDAFVHENVLFLLVADGQGSDDQGQSAGKVAIDEVRRYVLQHFVAGYESHLEYYVQQAFYVAQRTIEGIRKGNEDRYSGFCAAMSVLAITSQKEMVVAHVGHTQVSLFREGQLYPITEPQTVAYDLYKQQKISLTELNNHPDRRMLSQALGVVQQPRVITQRGVLMQRDMLLLGSDGLFDLGNTLIQQVIERTSETKETADELMRFQRERILYDDASVVITFLNF